MYLTGTNTHLLHIQMYVTKLTTMQVSQNATVDGGTNCT